MPDPDIIPPMTNPMGLYWRQPDPAGILVDEKHALMSAADLAGLSEYSTSVPSGVYPGKMWKALYGDASFLRWYGECGCGKPGCCAINTREILLA